MVALLIDLFSGESGYLRTKVIRNHRFYSDFFFFFFFLSVETKSFDVFHLRASMEINIKIFQTNSVKNWPDNNLNS